MGKFALECPKCGSINTASNFIFAKKVIHCGTCGEEINVKQAKLISKKCPSCGNVFIYDQSKKGAKECPACGHLFHNANEAKTVEYSVVSVECPQCGCGVEANKHDHNFTCPLCGEVFDVEKEYARAQQVKGSTISVIEYEGDNTTLVWKHPIKNFNMGSQLIVRESQEAVVFINGNAFGPYPAGSYTLDSENIPFLRKSFEFATGGQTPFPCEVYYVNKAVHMNIKWGVPKTVDFLDPKYHVPFRIGASGTYNLQVSDSRKLLIKLVGTTSGLKDNDIMTYISRGPIVTCVTTNMAQIIEDNKINILTISKHYEMLSARLQEKLSAFFEDYGIEIREFFITGIFLPEDDKNFQRIANLSSEGSIEIKEAEVQSKVIEAHRGTKEEIQKTKLMEEEYRIKRNLMEAEAKAAATEMQGLAEASVMVAKGYSEKDVIAAGVQKAYAEGLGNLGSGGGGGSALGDVAGMAVALGTMGGVIGMTKEAMAPMMNPSYDTKPAEPPVRPNAETWDCPNCGNKGITFNFCPNCGGKKPEPQEAWDCPNCGNKGITFNFCPNCGAKKPEPQEAWDCPNCGNKGITFNFCPNCGAKKPEPQEAWDCPSCGNKGITFNFCPNCGAKKPEQPEAWDCPECGNKGITFNFCPNCGAKKN